MQLQELTFICKVYFYGNKFFFCDNAVILLETLSSFFLLINSSTSTALTFRYTFFYYLSFTPLLLQPWLTAIYVSAKIA